jgi:hypothetical protein
VRDLSELDKKKQVRKKRSNPQLVRLLPEENKRKNGNGIRWKDSSPNLSNF